MEPPLRTISPQVKATQLSKRSSCKGLDMEKVGKIGEGLNSKSSSYRLQKTLENLKKLLGDTNPPDTCLKFSSISENQLIKTGPPSNVYSKGGLNFSRHLLYKIHKADAKLVRSILESKGFSYTDSHDWNIMWLGCSGKLYLYEGLHANQRINHFPNSFEITRKDKMYINLMIMQEKFGIKEYGFFPETYLMPEEFARFSPRYRNDRGARWIVKPSNSSQGRGIHILESLTSLESCESCVVSRFIHNPLLINDLKFDLRIYVLVTSFEPLKIYIYDEGLARFASEKYSRFSAANKFSFLTNYSINKQNEKYVQNEDLDHDRVGHKWSLSALLKYLRESGVDTERIMSKLYDLIIKTMIALESTVVPLVRKLNLHRNNCFDLFGFDILLDSLLQLWLLEVNLSPSLATDSPLDLFIKGNLVSEVFNVVGIKTIDRRGGCSRYMVKNRTNNMRATTAKSVENREIYEEIFTETLEEFCRTKNFVRIYPCEGCRIYDRFFNVPRKINKALESFLFKGQENKEIAQVVITGEELLIEYLSRIIAVSESVVFNERWENCINAFVSHEMWRRINLEMHSVGPLKKLLEILIELKRRNMKTSEKESNDEKDKIMQRFSSAEIENILRDIKDDLKSIISCLITDSFALLSELDSYTSNTPNRAYFDLNSLISKHKSTQ